MEGLSLNEDDPAQQIQIVEQFVSEGVGGIVLAPIDDTALKRSSRRCHAEKESCGDFRIRRSRAEPVKDFVSTVFDGARSGAERLADSWQFQTAKARWCSFALKVSATGSARGGLSGSNQVPDIQVIVENRYSGTTASEAQSTALRTPNKLRRRTGFSFNRTEYSVCCLPSSGITWRAARSSSGLCTRRGDLWKA